METCFVLPVIKGLQIQATLNVTSHLLNSQILLKYKIQSARFGSTYTKIGMIQRRLAWPLRKDDTQICEAFHILKIFYKKYMYVCI